MKAASRIRLPVLQEVKHGVVLAALLFGGCATVAPPPSPPTPAAVPTPAPAPATPAVPETSIVTPPPAAPAPPAPSLSFREFIALNDTKLLDVYVGMSRATVDKYMDAHETDRFTNPYKRQTLHAKDGTLYEILFYITREPTKGKPVTETQTTPLIFRDDKLVAIGRYQLKKLRRKLAN
jgi:hypothetical protein